MALGDVWVDRVDGEDTIYADDVNKLAKAIINLEKSEVVKYSAQELTDVQKAQVRENINVLSIDETVELAERLLEAAEGAVKYNQAQTLDSTQKAQARDNIGAVSEDYINELAGNLTIENLGGIAKPINATEGQFLRYIGGVWTASTVASAEGSSF